MKTVIIASVNGMVVLMQFQTDARKFMLEDIKRKSGYQTSSKVMPSQITNPANLHAYLGFQYRAQTEVKITLTIYDSNPASSMENHHAYATDCQPIKGSN